MTDPSPTAELIERLRDSAERSAEAISNYEGKQFPIELTDQWRAAATLASQAAEIARMRAALDWLAENRNLELSYYSPTYCDDDDQDNEWRVYIVRGPINDREWNVVGRGETLLDAIICARAALNGEPPKPRQFLKDALDEDRRNRP